MTDPKSELQADTTCGGCGFTAKTPAGLSTHQRSCDKVSTVESTQPDLMQVKEYEEYQFKVKFATPLTMDRAASSGSVYYKGIARVVSKNEALSRRMINFATKNPNVAKKVSRMDVWVVKSTSDIREMEFDDNSGFAKSWLWNWELVRLIERATVNTVVIE